MTAGRLHYIFLQLQTASRLDERRPPARCAASSRGTLGKRSMLPNKKKRLGRCRVFSCYDRPRPWCSRKQVLNPSAGPYACPAALHNGLDWGREEGALRISISPSAEAILQSRRSRVCSALQAARGATAAMSGNRLLAASSVSSCGNASTPAVLGQQQLKSMQSGKLCHCCIRWQQPLAASSVLCHSRRSFLHPLGRGRLQPASNTSSATDVLPYLLVRSGPFGPPYCELLLQVFTVATSQRGEGAIYTPSAPSAARSSSVFLSTEGIAHSTAAFSILLR